MALVYNNLIFLSHCLDGVDLNLALMIVYHVKYIFPKFRILMGF